MTTTDVQAPPSPSPAPPDATRARRSGIFSAELVRAAIVDSFPKLDPRNQLKNPVMFIVELGSIITSAIFFLELARGEFGQLWFVAVIAFWLWLTVLFANFAEAIAEGRRHYRGRPGSRPAEGGPRAGARG